MAVPFVSSLAPEEARSSRAGLKRRVETFWEAASCGEKAYAIGDEEQTRLTAQAEARYRLEPYLKPFARFEDGRDRDVLEIGVGMGADHHEWAKAEPRSLTGVDLTERAIALTDARLKQAGLRSVLRVSDAEQLPFADQSFDLVYSWGVLHHSPDTQKAFAEAGRVLRPGGVARIMIYHTYSLTGFMLWARYGLLKGKPFVPLHEVYDRHLESPGTKAFTTAQAAELCRQAGFREWRMHVQLNHGDLLQGAVGQQHQGWALQIAKAVWPRWLLRRATPFLGLYLMIEART